jgi:hypothetical protein
VLVLAVGTEYVDKDIVREAINIPGEVFEKALYEFVDPGAHDCVEVEYQQAD